MLVNFSNHSSALWSKKQLDAANSIYDKVYDIDFPKVNPNGNVEYISALADQYVNEISALGVPDDIMVHAMGELTLTFSVVSRLQKMGYKCVASTTERIVTLLDNNRKEVVFEFVRFREYPV